MVFMQTRVADSLAYYSERVIEMLFDRTRHIYKSPVFNTILLAKEYYLTSKQVDKNELSKSYLDSILEEFIYSIVSDPIFDLLVGKSEINHYVKQLNKGDYDKQKETITYIYYKYLNEYLTVSKDYLRDSILSNKKSHIEKGIRCFLPSLIDIGYSSEFIHYYTRKTFKEKKLKTIEDFELYLSRFDNKNREYSVFFSLEKSAIIFKDILEKRLRVSLIDNIDIGVPVDTDKYCLAKVKVDALDKPNAAGIAFEIVSFLFHYYCFLENRKHSWYENKCIVEDMDGNRRKIAFGNQQLRIPRSYDEEEAKELSEKIITFLLSKSGAFYTIDNAITTYYLALDSSNLQDAYINLWSILEVLFCVGNLNKIGQIEEKLIPILKYDYISSLFSEIETMILKSNYKREYQTIIEQVGSVQNLFLLEENSDYVEQLKQSIKGYPLLRYRIHALSKTCKSKKTLNKELSRYTKRVKWHLTRLYRTRNLIIHSSNNIYNLKMICVHLCEYVEVTLQIIIATLVNYPQLHNLQNIFFELLNNDYHVDKILKSSDPFNEEDVKQLFILQSRTFW